VGEIAGSEAAGGGNAGGCRLIVRVAIVGAALALGAGGEARGSGDGALVPRVGFGRAEYERVRDLPLTWASPGADPDSSLTVSGYMQHRHVLSFQNGGEGKGAAGADVATGRDIRRLRIRFDGHVGDPSLRYHISHSFTRSGSDGLADARIDKDLGDSGLTLTMGRFRLPMLREFFQSAPRLLAVDRSLTHSVFTLDRSTGIQLGYESDESPFRGSVAASNGINSLEGFEVEDTEWAVTGRGELLLAGDSFSRFRYGATDDEEGFSWMVGAAGHAEGFREGGHLYQWTLDSEMKGTGWSLFGAAIGRRGDPLGLDDFYDMGFVVQGAVRATERLEPFLRYDVVVPDGDRSGDDPFNTITAGVNYFIAGHAIKLSADVQWFIDAAGENDLVRSFGGIGFIDNGTNAGEVALRLQLQIMF